MTRAFKTAWLAAAASLILTSSSFGSIVPDGTTSTLVCQTEPNVQTALKWWTPQRGVWTPIGWKDHLFRFNVMYNGDLLCPPTGHMEKPHIKKYAGQDFQLNFKPSADGSLPPVPDEPTPLYKIDGGVGVQRWKKGNVAPVLQSEWPMQEGVVMRQEIFAHMEGGGSVTTGTEPLYAWVRLSVAHVDPIRAPEKVFFAVQLSNLYYRNFYPFALDDSVTMTADPRTIQLADPLGSEPLPAKNNDTPGLRVTQENGKTRILVLPGGAGPVTMAETTTGSGVYALRIELPVEEGAFTDVLVPMLATSPEVIDKEAALGYDNALAQAERYWSQAPETAAVISTPEEYINEALARNIQFAQIIAERNPDTGEYAFLSGSYGYDALWSTPTSMIAHMFLDLLGYHDVVKKHVELYKANQGSVKPPGPAYTLHPGYFSTPKSLTALDWVTDHGAIMEMLSRHALLTGDGEFIDHWLEALIKGCDFVKDMCAKTDHEGVPGLMPPGNATDTLHPVQAIWTQAWTYKGLKSTVEVLKRINHPRTGELSEFAAQFKDTFKEGFLAAIPDEPQWTDPDGNVHHILPHNLAPPAPYHPFDDAFLLDTGALVLPWADLFDAADPRMKAFGDYFRVGPPTKLWGPRSSPVARAILIHEISTCEPCYSWNIVNSWETGDREKFLEGMYALFTGAISPQTYINGEHRDAMYGTVFVAPLMTWALRQAVIDDEISPGEIHLLRLCPLAWLSKDQDTIFENMPTLHGPVNLRFRLSDDAKSLEVTFDGEWRHKPSNIKLHLPPLEGLTTVSVNGINFPAAETITLDKF